MTVQAQVVSAEVRLEDLEGIIRLTLRPSLGDDFVIFWDDDDDVLQVGEYVNVTMSIADNQTVDSALL